MKFFTLILSLLVCGLTGYAQQVDSTQVGKIIYYEGKVELGVDPNWTRVKINTPVKRNQYIRIPGDGIAEITWNGGTKSIVGPNSNISITSLFLGSSGKSKSQTEGVFNDFKNMFSATAQNSKSQEGGIRRSETMASPKQGPDTVYWKQDEEITFQEAFALYENQEYGKAIAALQAFIYQKPDDPMAVYATFALGHCYIMANNPVKAKQIFADFITRYPDDPLRIEAEKVEQQL